MTIRSPLRGAAALLFLIAVSIAIWSPPASAQRADDIETLLEQSDRLTQAGKYREASEITKRLLTETERRFGSGHKYVATTLNNLAELYRFQGRKVRDTVMTATKNAQEPFTYGSLPGEQLYLKIAATQ